MRKPKIEVEKINTKYELSINQDELIYAYLNTDNTIDLTTHRNKREFIFRYSDPERIKRIAELILKASELK